MERNAYQPLKFDRVESFFIDRAVAKDMYSGCIVSRPLVTINLPDHPMESFFLPDRSFQLLNRLSDLANMEYRIDWIDRVTRGVAIEGYDIELKRSDLVPDNLTPELIVVLSQLGRKTTAGGCQ